MNSINSAGKQIISLSLLSIQNDKWILIGIALFICFLLFVFGVVPVWIRKGKKVDPRTDQYVNDDTDELPDLSRYDLQDCGFVVEEDITFVHTNKNTG